MRVVGMRLPPSVEVATPRCACSPAPQRQQPACSNPKDCQASSSGPALPRAPCVQPCGGRGRRIGDSKHALSDEISCGWTGAAPASCCSRALAPRVRTPTICRSTRPAPRAGVPRLVAARLAGGRARGVERCRERPGHPDHRGPRRSESRILGQEQQQLQATGSGRRRRAVRRHGRAERLPALQLDGACGHAPPRRHRTHHHVTAGPHPACIYALRNATRTPVRCTLAGPGPAPARPTRCAHYPASPTHACQTPATSLEPRMRAHLLAPARVLGNLAGVGGAGVDAARARAALLLVRGAVRAAAAARGL